MDGTSRLCTADGNNTENTKYLLLRHVARAQTGGRTAGRTFPRLRSIATVLGAAALLPVFAAPAAAGGVPYVSNIGQSDDDTALLTFVDFAQGFTTGSQSGGYSLGSVEIFLTSAPGNDSSMSVSLRAEDSSGEPHDRLCNLTGPSNIDAGINRFEAAADCPNLTADTTYFIRVGYGTDSPRLRVTYSTAEDSGASSGWSISDRYYLHPNVGINQGQWRKASSDHALAIRVNAPNTIPTASDKAVTIDDDGEHTFSVSDFGFSDADTGDELDHVEITSLPAGNLGTLSLDGDTLESGDLNKVVTKADLDSGNLIYTPPADAGGEAFVASFQFRVSDGDDDSESATFDIGVTPEPLSVSFGSAAYETEEDDEVEVGVRLNVSAIVPLTIPITVRAGTAEPEGDFTVTVTGPEDAWNAETGTVTLTFGAGVATKSFTIMANQDDDSHDETVMLGFGALPPGTEAGEPGEAVLTIADVEGAAVRARFRRLSSEILSKHALTVADVTNRAIGERMDDPCGEPAAAYTLAGGSTLHHTLGANAQAIEDGTLTLHEVLASSSFLLPLGAVDDDMAGGPGGPVLWGRGDRRTLESKDSAFAWDGTVLTGQLGIDGCLRDDLVTGLTLSRSIGAFDYTDGTGPAPVSGDYESRMTSVHPYLGWLSPQGLGLWATVGNGQGGIEIDDGQAGRQTSDTSLTTAAMGASGPVMSDGSLIEGGTTTLMLKGEASVARVEVEGNDELIEEQTVIANRLRLALEGSHERALAGRGSLTPSLELGLRQDGGDGETGGGIEIGGSLRYRDPAAGLTIEGGGRVLTGQGDYREWGLGGSFGLDPGAGGRGLSLSLALAWGETSSRVARLWDQDVAALATDDTAANDNVSRMRLDSEFGYGFGVLGGRGLLTPYGGLSLVGDDGQRHRLGARLAIGSAFTLGLEGERREPTHDAAAEHGVMLRLQARW